MTTEIAFKLIETAEWRERKAEKHVEDVRNLDAAKTMRELADQSITADVGEQYSAAYMSYEAAFDGVDNIDNVEQFVTQEVMVDHLIDDDMRSIGFGWTPKHIDDVARSMTENYATATSLVLAAIQQAKASA